MVARAPAEVVTLYGDFGHSLGILVQMGNDFEGLAGLQGKRDTEQRLKQRTQILVDRVLYGGWYDYQSFISGTSEALRGALDPSSISRVLEKQIVGTMRCRAMATLVLDHRAHAFCVRGGLGFDETLTVSGSGAVARFLLAVGKPVERATLCGRFAAESEARQELAAWTAGGVQM
jgi:hypothetical protein